MAAGHPAVRPEAIGSVGASPAATTAWIGRREPAPEEPGRRYLEAVVRGHGGPVPCTVPITVFERAWSLAWLSDGPQPA